MLNVDARVALFGSAALLALLSSGARATDYTVTDGGDTGAAGQFRTQVGAANNNPGTDRILFGVTTIVTTGSPVFVYDNLQLGLPAGNNVAITLNTTQPFTGTDRNGNPTTDFEGISVRSGAALNVGSGVTINTTSGLNRGISNFSVGNDTSSINFGGSLTGGNFSGTGSDPFIGFGLIGFNISTAASANITLSDPFSSAVVLGGGTGTYQGVLSGGFAGLYVVGAASPTVQPGATVSGGQYGIVLDPAINSGAGANLVLNGGSVTGATAAIEINSGINTLALTNAATINGGVLVNGGTTTVTGTNPYTGATTVNGGSFIVNGSIVSPVAVNGGVLGGNGSVGAVTVAAGGTLAPGSSDNPTGMLAAASLSFAPNSFYQVSITPTASSRTNVVGTTNIAGGTVNVLAGGGPYAPSTTYPILTSTAGVTGQFGAVFTNLAFLVPSLSYDANDVFLTITATGNYGAAAQTQNQRAVAAGLTNAAQLATGSPPVLNALNQLTVAQAQAAFDSLSGEGIAAAQNVAHRSSQLFTGSITDQTTFYGSDRGGANQIVLTVPQPGGERLGFQAIAPASGPGADAFRVQPIRELADLPAARPKFIEAAPVASTRTWRAWGTGFGADEDVHSNAAIGFAAQQNSIVGGSVGVDYQVAPGTLVGLAVGGTDGSFNVPNRATSGSTTGGHVAGYSLASFGSYYGAASLSGSFFQNRTTRTVAGFGGLAAETEKGSFSSREVRARLEAGRSFASPYAANATITPFVALEVASLRSDGFAEQSIAGAGVFALNVSGQSTADVPAFIGLRFASASALGNGMVLKPVLQLAYVHEFAPERQIFAGINSLPGAVFLVDGARPARDAAQVKAGGELILGARTALFANFDGEFARASQLYGGKGGLKFLF